MNPNSDQGVSRLPAAPMLERWVLEEPIPALIILVLAGVIAFVLLNRAGRGRDAMLAAAGGIFLGAGVWALALLVQTDREGLRAEAARAVSLLMASDVQGVEGMLADGVSVRLVGRDTQETKASILEHIRRGTVLRYVRPTGWSISGDRAVIEGESRGKTQMRVVVETEIAGRVGSWWLIHWQRDASGRWRIREVEAQHIDFVPYGTPIDVR